MRVPRLREPYVRLFCRRVVPGGLPCMVQHEPLPGAPQKECFRIVPEQVAAHGGEQVVGWALWEWRKVMLVAEFHAVWRDPNGHLVDLTPRPTQLHKIAFVADPQRDYKGVQVDNVRQPLGKDPRITRLIAFEERITALMNEGDLAQQHGVEGAAEVGDIQDQMTQLQAALVERYGWPD